MDCSPLALYFPADALRNHRVINVLQIFNPSTTAELDIKVKTTHPKEVLAEPRKAIVQPQQALLLFVQWHTIAPLDVHHYTDLNPKRQPKLLVEGATLGGQELIKSLRLPLFFTQPAPGEAFAYYIDGHLYSNVAALSTASNSLSIPGGSRSYSKPSFSNSIGHSETPNNRVTRSGSTGSHTGQDGRIFPRSPVNRDRSSDQGSERGSEVGSDTRDDRHSKRKIEHARPPPLRTGDSDGSEGGDLVRRAEITRLRSESKHRHRNVNLNDDFSTDGMDRIAHARKDRDYREKAVSDLHRRARKLHKRKDDEDGTAPSESDGPCFCM
eukprot:TRINITY_DN58161_c0_g1_i1.p1 TRINITY_DN58161_c0_g1~~TRINITY_DN58161_c0_g1_i1.p1  ORF type:complete len:342 (-),score=9.21 TRINITY_DN58161_c0_g1_i1:83-1057(-)